ncbi:MAG: NAD(+) synthase, partial [Muribaculum sp.]|nr:NAD(+) synthase [Muribaculum sp.]
MENGYIRVASVIPAVKVADVSTNVENIISMARELAYKNVRLAVFPELSLTGYTCGDLFQHRTLLDATLDGINSLMEFTRQHTHIALIVGAPLVYNGVVYNCAITIKGGIPIAAVPKIYLPNYGEFYEKRWFGSGASLPSDDITIKINGHDVPFGIHLLTEIAGVKVGMELCEDLWGPIPPSTRASLAGAQIIANLSASNDLIGKYEYLQSVIMQQSSRCLGAYIYASAGFGESTTDLAYDGKAIIAENGFILAINDRWTRKPSMIIADVDIDAIDYDRIHNTTFAKAQSLEITRPYRVVVAPGDTLRADGQLYRTVDPHPFVPEDTTTINSRCADIVNIQISGLAQRLKATGTKALVVGISGGLDSTLALLVATRAFDVLGLDRKGIVGVTMPGYGTTDRTHDNAVTLMTALGITQKEISIVPAVNQHFADLGHNSDIHDVTYENAQARERTQILMDTANQVGGMVLGTGDLSELALGWATFNGDHMSMYGINSGIPKTLVRSLVEWFAARTENTVERATLLDIAATPISPELIPANTDGTIAQKTEDLVGPYELHDFFIYYMLRFG